MKIIQMQFVPQENSQFVGVSGQLETSRRPPLLFGLGDDGIIYKQVTSKDSTLLKWEIYIFSTLKNP